MVTRGFILIELEIRIFKVRICLVPVNKFFVSKLEEKESRKLHEIIQNRKALSRSILSATRKLFGGNNSKAQVAEKYTESVEVQTRRLGDLCLMLQQYEPATQLYNSAKRDLSNDQNWIEATSASEFAAIAVFMAESGTRHDHFPKQVTAHAINSYFNLNHTELAIRSAFTTLEAVRSVGAFQVGYLLV